VAIAGFLKELISPVTDIIGEVVVDKDKAREIQLEIEKLADKADERLHDQIIAQTEINKEEAKSSHLFVAGWRPFVGWTSGVGLGYATIIEPMMRFFASVNGYTGQFPEFDTGLLITILGGMLGLAGMRTFEKHSGKAREDLSH